MKAKKIKVFKKKCPKCKSKLEYTGADFIFAQERVRGYYLKFISIEVIKVKCPVCESIIKK